MKNSLFNKNYKSTRQSHWKYFFITLGVLQALTTLVFIFYKNMLGQNSDYNPEGINGLNGIVYVTFVYLLVFAAASIPIFNLISLPIYIKKSTLTKKQIWLSALSLLLSIILVAYSIFIYLESDSMINNLLTTRPSVTKNTEDSESNSLQVMPSGSYEVNVSE